MSLVPYAVLNLELALCTVYQAACPKLAPTDKAQLPRVEQKVLQDKHLNIQLSWGRSLKVWVARVLGRSMHDEDH